MPNYHRTIIVVLMGILVASIGIARGTATDFKLNSQSLSVGAIRAIIHQGRDCWIEGDAATFSSLFTEDGELLAPGHRWIGRRAIAQAVTDFASHTASVTIEIRRIIIEKNHAVVEWHWEDTAKVTGKRTPADDAIVIDFRGDRIERWREYIDSQTPQSQSVWKG